MSGFHYGLVGLLIYRLVIASSCMSVSVNTTATEASLEKYKQKLEQKFIKLSKRLSFVVAQSAIEVTPYGDVDRYRGLYEYRKATKGYEIQAGLAKGSWTVQVGSSASKGAIFYDDRQGSEALGSAIGNVQSFKLGDSIYINNTLDYIKQLENGYSQQAPQGMLKPALEHIKAVYKINLQQVLDADN